MEKVFTFSDLVSSPDKKFLKLFKPIFTRGVQSPLQTIKFNPREKPNTMSGLPSSSEKGSHISRLVPPGSMTKRPREGSFDIESGLDAKKSKLEVAGASSNLNKSKSRSMMSIAGRSAVQVELPQQVGKGGHRQQQAPSRSCPQSRLQIGGKLRQLLTTGQTTV